MKTFTEREAEDFLEKEGFEVVKRLFIKEKKELREIGVNLNFPWVMKISSRHIVHKAKIGGTVLNIKSLDKAEKAFDHLKEIDPSEGILVQEMLNGEELILGIKATPEFPRVIMFGKGGSNVEEERDIAFRISPLKEEDVDQIIRDTKIYQVLRNKRKDLALLKKAILKISKLSEEYNIQELDINPLILNETQAAVVDARIIMD